MLRGRGKKVIHLWQEKNISYNSTRDSCCCGISINKTLPVSAMHLDRTKSAAVVATEGLQTLMSSSLIVLQQKHNLFMKCALATHK